MYANVTESAMLNDIATARGPFHKWVFSFLRRYRQEFRHGPWFDRFLHPASFNAQHRTYRARFSSSAVLALGLGATVTAGTVSTAGTVIRFSQVSLHRFGATSRAQLLVSFPSGVLS